MTQMTQFTVQTRKCVHIYSNCDNVKLQNDSATLTFEVGMWFLDVIDICAICIPQYMTKLQSGHE
jgi:hypothetical protein